MDTFGDMSIMQQLGYRKKRRVKKLVEGFSFFLTVKSRVVDWSTIQFFYFFGGATNQEVLLNEMCYYFLL